MAGRAVNRRHAPLLRQMEALRLRYESPEALATDPLSIPLRYSDPWDRELTAWVAAHLAYGRVAPMLRAIDQALKPLGPSPATHLRENGLDFLHDLKGILAPWKWRFHTASDLVEWLLAWKRLDQESGGQGLEPHLKPGPGLSTEGRLSSLVQKLRLDMPETLGNRFSLPDPSEGSACKRWRMFLRWMVRPGWPDLGMWKNYPVPGLIIPLDTHVARISRFIGLTRRRTPDGLMALEITESLRQLAPDDPLKYDFALSHLGILGDCPGTRTLPRCRACPLVSLCTAGQER